MAQQIKGGPGRRDVLKLGLGAAGVLMAPAVLRAQTAELVVGGAASHKPWVESIVAPAFEKKYKCKVLFEGTKSLVNLEKMQKNKGAQYMSVVQMDDPVMILAVKEGLLEPLTVAKVPNLADLVAGAVHMDGMWANYLQPWLGIAYNKTEMKTPPASWADLFEAKYKGRIVIPSPQNTEGLPLIFIAAALAAGVPLEAGQKDAEAGFRKLATLPQADLAYAYVNELLSAPLQAQLAGPTSSLGANKATPKPAGLPADLKVIQIDWANVAAERSKWVSRWDRDMAL
ncbi:MAG: hypothetical protein B7Y84_19365 [Azorhizobium sp. 32-67-21]|nr:MAG: hypothetical protein B7Y84_19365 [Azorhizobium sp. 32-67-21]